MTARPYPTYRETGLDWLGKVPSAWKLKRLDHFFTERRRKVSDRDFEPLSVTKNGVVRQLETVAKSDDNDNRKLVCAGDFVINGRSDRKGSSGISAVAGSVSLINIVMEPRGIDKRFVHYLLRSEPFQQEFYRFGKGIVADLWSTGYDEMRNIVLAVPTPNEQNDIVNFLDLETAKIDALIAEQERLIELLVEKRQAVILHAVTKGLNPDVSMKPSAVEWLGSVPAHWRLMPLKHLVTFRSGGTPNKENLQFWDGDVPWASAKDIKTEVLFDTEDHLTTHAIETGAADLIPTGAVVVVVRGMILARTFPVTLVGAPMAINQDLKALLPSKAVVARFIAWYLRGTESESLNRLDEAGHGTKALRMDAWSSLVVALPPTTEQEEIAGFIEAEASKAASLISESERAITLLRERRSALISAAVTGKIDVRKSAAGRAQ